MRLNKYILHFKLQSFYSFNGTKKIKITKPFFHVVCDFQNYYQYYCCSFYEQAVSSIWAEGVYNKRYADENAKSPVNISLSGYG